MPRSPPNIEEFNQFAGLVFAQLYKAFPLPEDIDKAKIAEAMGVSDPDWSKYILPSGRSFNEMLAHTIAWLNSEDFIRASGGHPAAHVLLTTKGLAAMSARPAGLEETLGTELTNAAGSGSNLNLSGIGEMVGSFFGGLIKTLSS